MATMRKSIRTRQRVMDAAASALSQRGYVGTTLNDIADLAGMKAGSFYYHFESKDALIEAVLRYGVRQSLINVETAIDRLPAEATAVDKLRTALRAHVEAALESSDYTAAHVRCLEQVPETIRQSLEPEIRRLGDLWNSIIDDVVHHEGIRDDLETPTIRLLIIGAITWLVEWPRRYRRPAEEIADTMFELVMNGLTRR